jgi:hypothetical protein
MKEIITLAMKITILSLCSLILHISHAQTNLFPLHSSGMYSGPTVGDYTGITNAQLKLQATSGYIRVPHLSENAVISAVYNFETGKNVYWGEPNDAGLYVFRGRNTVIEQGKLGIGTTSPEERLELKSETPVLSLHSPGQATFKIGVEGGLFKIASMDNGFGGHIGSFASNDVQVLTMTSSSNVGIGTTSPGTWFPSKTLEVSANRPVLKLTASLPTDLSTIVFTNSNIDAANHMGEFHVNYQFSQNDNSKSLLRFGSYPSGEVLSLRSDGFVGIGTSSPDAKLTVKGIIHTQEVKIDLQGAVAPDYVFEKDYNLPSLESIKSYIDQNKHLPEVPSAKEMEANGVNVGEMNMILLKKVEELMLYVIELKNENDRQNRIIEKLKNK